MPVGLEKKRIYKKAYRHAAKAKSNLKRMSNYIEYLRHKYPYLIPGIIDDFKPDPSHNYGALRSYKDLVRNKPVKYMPWSQINKLARDYENIAKAYWEKIRNINPQILPDEVHKAMGREYEAQRYTSLAFVFCGPPYEALKMAMRRNNYIEAGKNQVFKLKHIKARERESRPPPRPQEIEAYMKNLEYTTLDEYLTTPYTLHSDR